MKIKIIRRRGNASIFLFDTFHPPFPIHLCTHRCFCFCTPVRVTPFATRVSRSPMLSPAPFQPLQSRGFLRLVLWQRATPPLFSFPVPLALLLLCLAVDAMPCHRVLFLHPFPPLPGALTVHSPSLLRTRFCFKRL